MGELSDFNFNIKYRPGASNTDADSLSRLPGYFEQYMASCTQAVSQEELGATVTSICAQGNGDVTWLSSFTTDQSLLYEDETFLLHNPSCGQINVVDIAQAQDRDRNTKRVKDIIKSQQTPILKERKLGTAEVKRFLFELPKLYELTRSLISCTIGHKWCSRKNSVDACLKSYTRTWVTWDPRESWLSRGNGFTGHT